MMRKNDSFETVAKVLQGASRVLLYTHVSMDGDAMGSSVALCRVLRQMHKACFVVLEDEIPENLQFLDEGYTLPLEEVEIEPEISVAIDCGDDTRYPNRAELFHRAPVTVCVDHHPTTEPVHDYNIIDPSAAAAAELVYEVIRALGQPIDQDTAEALYVGINTDTGRFQYSNTTALTHRITADLIDCGVDVNRMNVELYESQRPEKMLMESRILGRVAFYGDGKLAMASISKEEMEEHQVRSGDTDNVIALMRSIRGVEIAAFLKEKKENEIRVSFRAKGACDVSAIAAEYNGGGHRKAAGATIRLPLAQAMEDVKEKALKSIAEHEDN